MGQNFFSAKVAIVTGASSGIGRSTALALARRGACVALAARNKPALEGLARQIQEAGGEALAITTDVTQQEQVERMVAETISRWGQVDILVSNAGQYIRSPISELTMPILERSIAVNFYGHVHAVLAVLPYLLQRQSGQIALVSSMDGRKGLTPDSPYVSAKFALNGFAEVLRQELYGSGIQVSLVLPGRVDTPMIENLTVPGIQPKIPADQVAQAILRAIERRQAEVYIPALTRLLYVTNTVAPRLADWVARAFHLEGWETGQARGRSREIKVPETAHSWLRKIRLAYVPGQTTPLLEEFAAGLLEAFQNMGHELLSDPAEGPDVLLTTAPFGVPLNWREALLFTARRRFDLEHTPLIFTLLHATPDQFQSYLGRFADALAKDPFDPADFAFPGLAPKAYETLYEQGRRAGPILSLVRLLQSQAKSIRLILLVGAERPEEAYTFDLVGAYPCTVASNERAFYTDLALRIVTAASTDEITDHQVLAEPVPRALWRSLTTPSAMQRAGQELGKRNFFTEMVRVANLVSVPAVPEAVASQYSEGCFATWDPALGALVTTVTGSARPVEKDRLTDDELAVIVGVRPDGRGAQVRHVQGKRNDPPSSEAVELYWMDDRLPRIRLGPGWEITAEVPVARSKLHGHRGVKSYDPGLVEHVYLDPAYYHYPVSCSTEAQAHGIRAAFARSTALAHPEDPRQAVFTVLPGHGLLLVEKWVQGKEPFQILWEFMDAGILEIDNQVPQGPLAFVPDGRGRMVLEEGDQEQ